MYTFFSLPYLSFSSPPLLPSYIPTSCLTFPFLPLLLTFSFFTPASPYPPSSSLLPSLTDPMCALCSRSRGLIRSTSAHVGTGTKAPSVARRRESLPKDLSNCYMFLFYLYKYLHRIQWPLHPNYSQLPYILHIDRSISESQISI